LETAYQAASAADFEVVASAMMHSRLAIAVFAALSLFTRLCDAGDTTPVAADAPFAATLAPFLKSHCAKCHGGSSPEAELSLERYRDSAHIQTDYAVWEKVLKMLSERQMPPDDEPQPSEADRQAAIRAIEAEMAKFDCGGERHPGRVTIRRLNRVEYNNTIRDLIGIDFKPADDFPSDDVGNGFDNIGDVLSIPPILLEKYLAAAESIVEKAFADQAARDRILAVKPEPDGSNRRQVMRQNLATFATRAFRRPTTDDELSRIYRIVQFARDLGSSDEEAMQSGLQAILSSPHFLFRVELDPAADDADGIRELNDYELASRLSYFVWSSMPDEELFTLARQGTLRQPEVLRAQAARMLRDPKSKSLIKDFAGQWLQLRDLPNLTPDQELFPAFDEELRQAMLQETELFLEALIREDRSVLDLLNADFSYVNERLARHYGLTGVEGDEFRRVKLPDQRRGVLTHGSILLLTSNPTRTSPVKRGKWILDNILGEPPLPPPAGVPELDEGVELLGSLRERMEQHRADESCAVCHRQMDTLGFGLENFDAIGAWRVRDGQAEIDASGSLPGGYDFRSPKELMELLKEQHKQQFCRCLTQKMLTYALGRGLEPYDRCAVDTIMKKLAEDDFRFSSLVTGIVTSDPFMLREAKGDK